MTHKEINQRIFEIAKARGIKTVPLASMSGVGYTVLNRMQKRPDSAIDLLDAVKLCRVLGISLSQLISGEINPYEQAVQKISKTLNQFNDQVKELTVLV